MKYGITFPDGKTQPFAECWDARAAFIEARGAMIDGESVSLWAESATGSRVNLETVTQPRIFDMSAIMN